MKTKTTALFLSVIMLAAAMSGCGTTEEERTMNKFSSANTVTKLLESYDNFMMQYELPGDIISYVYMDKDTLLETDEEHTYAVLFSPEESCEVGFWDDGTPYFDRYVNLFDENMAAAARADDMLSSTTSAETISMMKEENGILYMETSLDADQVNPEEMESLGLTLAEGDQYVCQYQIEPGSYRLLQSEEYVKHADGTSEYIGRVTMTVNAERPAYIDELIARGDEIDAMPEEQTRSITFIVDPGLNTERTVTQKVIRGDYILYPTDLHGYAYYTDPAGTQLYEAPDGEVPEEHSTTLYMIKAE